MAEKSQHEQVMLKPSSYFPERMFSPCSQRQAA